MEPMKVELTEPVKDAEGNAVTELTLREPRVCDQIEAQRLGKTSAEQEVHLFAAISGVPAKSLRNMTLREYYKVQAAYGRFFGEHLASPAENSEGSLSG